MERINRETRESERERARERESRDNEERDKSFTRGRVFQLSKRP